MGQSQGLLLTKYHHCRALNDSNSITNNEAPFEGY